MTAIVTMNLQEVKHNTNVVHLVDLDGDSKVLLCGANTWTDTEGKRYLLRGGNTTPVTDFDARCKKCAKKVGGTFRSATEEQVEETRRGLEAILAIESKPDLKGLGPVQYALAVWLLDRGYAEAQRGYGHVSAAELAEALVGGDWIRDA